MADRSPHDRRTFKAHRIPERSLFYQRIMPAMFIVLVVIMAGLILFALGVLLGLVPWF